MKKGLQIGNCIAFILMILVNYISNTGILNNTTIGEVSDNYKSLLTPAGYTFSIWGLIYLLLLGFTVYQARNLFAKHNHDDFITNVGWWFIASCFFNCCWVFAWIYGYTALSCLFIFLLLFSLVKIIINNRMELDDKPISIILFLWWPFVIYCGWVTVASIANVSTYLVKIDWNGFGLSESSWAIMLIVIASTINFLVTWRRNMREFALVGAWALIGIGVANKDSNDLVMYTAFSIAVLLITSSLIHGFKNRETSPLIKLKQYINGKD